MQQQQPIQFTYVMLNNQLTQVPILYQGQANPNFAPQLQIVYQQPPVVGIPINENNQFQPNNAVYPQDSGVINPVTALNQYTKNVLCYTLTFLILFVGCIGVQYGLYGSLTAARLWISSYAFLIATLCIFFIIKRISNSFWFWILLLQAFILILSLALEIAAFAISVQHPVLFNYEEDIDPKYAIYNNRRILYTYSECQDYYYWYSYSDYQKYYGQQCDPILGYGNTTTYYTYSQCKGYYDSLSSSDYKEYFSEYCDSILGINSNNNNSTNNITSGNDTYSTYASYCQDLYDYSYSYYQNFKYACDPLLGYYVSSSEYDYTKCQTLYSLFTYSTYQTYYSVYCDSYLNKKDQKYSNGNLCDGYYDPLKDYCYPLQYGMLAYAVINFFVYLILFGALSRRIYTFFIHVRGQLQVQPQNNQMGFPNQ